MDKVKGFTPTSDYLTEKYNFLVAGVYGKVWRYYDHFGKCTASIPRIARELNISERTVHRAVNQLVADGFITKTSQSGKASILVPTNKINFRTTVEVVINDEPLPESQGLTPARESGVTQSQGLPLPESQGKKVFKERNNNNGGSPKNSQQEQEPFPFDQDFERPFFGNDQQGAAFVPPVLDQAEGLTETHDQLWTAFVNTSGLTKICATEEEIKILDWMIENKITAGDVREAVMIIKSNEKYSLVGLQSIVKTLDSIQAKRKWDKENESKQSYEFTDHTDIYPRPTHGKDGKKLRWAMTDEEKLESDKEIFGGR